MLSIIHQFAFYIHITIGAISLIAFWLPLFTKKGSIQHKRFGKVYVNCMYIVSISGVIMASLILIDPIAIKFASKLLTSEQTERMITKNRLNAGFLFMLSILVFTNVRQSVASLRVKQEREKLRTTFYISPLVLLIFTGLIMGKIGIESGIVLFMVFSIIAVVVGLSMIRYIYKPEIKEREWILEHMGNIFGAGIGSYTAFFAFGGRRLFSEIFVGNLQMLPWILPSVIGIVASIYFGNKYRRQFGVE